MILIFSMWWHLKCMIIDQILAVRPPGIRLRLLAILKVVIFFCTFCMYLCSNSFFLQILWHLYLRIYFYGVCHSRRPGCLHQIGPRGKLLLKKVSPSILPKFKWLLYVPGGSAKPPGYNRIKSLTGLKTSPTYPALNVRHWPF